MAFTYEDILRAQSEALAVERTQAMADLEAARHSEDGDATMYASERILNCDQRAAALNRVAQNYVAQQQQQPRGSQFGLNFDEQDVARISGISEQEYARNKQRMHQMKGQGYWSQGRVFK